MASAYGMGLATTAPDGNQAGKVETSLLGALHPELVDLSRIPATPQPGHTFAMGADAPQSDRRVGERWEGQEDLPAGSPGGGQFHGTGELAVGTGRPRHFSVCFLVHFF